MMKKKLLLIGNKPLNKVLSQEQINYINSFDVIVRINKFDNILDTGCRIDWLCTTGGMFWDVDVLKTKDIERFNRTYNPNIHKQINKIFLNKDSTKFLKEQLGIYFKHIKTNKRKILNIFKLLFKELNEQIDVNIIENCYTSIWKHFDLEIDKTIPYNRPTSSILFLAYLLKNYNQEYDIYFACLDIEKRDVMLKQQPIWRDSIHRNAGEFETMFLLKMINENKLHYIDLYA